MATFLIMIIQVEDALRDRVDKFETKVVSEKMLYFFWLD